MKIYQIGGSVRDALLGKPPQDIDYVVVGATPADMLALGYQQVGSSFPVFLHPTTGDEYALARTEQKIAPGYNGFAVRFDPGVSLRDDLYRRDLTINAMAIDPETGDLIDPFNGQQDLLDKKLRHVSDAFAEDPVRVLRVARFAARYTDFTVDPSTIELMERVVPELNHVAKERIWAEIEKGLLEASPAKMFNVLFECRALSSGRTGGVSALEPFDGVDIVALGRIESTMSLEARFSLVGRLFSKDPAIGYSYDTWRVPSAAAKLNELVNQHLNNILQYQQMSKQSRLELFQTARVYNSFETITELLDVAKVYLPADEWENVAAQVMKDVVAVKSVDAEAIAFSCSSGSEIVEKLKQARLDVLADLE